MGGCLSTPGDKYETNKEVTELKAQVDQLQKQLAAATGKGPVVAAAATAGGKPQGPAPVPAPAGGAAGGGVVETLFFPDAKLPCRNARKPGGCHRLHCDYAHGPTSLTRFLDHLGSARRTLDICVFTITNDDIADVVLAAHSRGVRVRIITDNDQAVCTGSDIAKFRAAGIQVRQDNTPAHMHHKFALIDGRLLLNGSFNWTRQAVTSNNENVTVLADPALIKSFAEQFETLWAAFK